MAQPTCFAHEVHDEYQDNARDAEDLLFDVVREGRSEFLTSERAFLARFMNWDEKQCRQQLTRVRNVLRLQSIAGTPEDREAALNECQTSTDLAAKECPKLQEKIEKLQAQLNGLERDARLAQKRVEEQATACDQLRQHCPAGIVERVRKDIRVIDAGIGQDLRDAKARQLELRSILNLDNCHGSVEKHLAFGLKHLLPDAVEIVVDGDPTLGPCSQLRRYSEQWPALKAAAEREHTELTTRLPELQAEYDGQIQAAELPLDYYCDPKNQEQN